MIRKKFSNKSVFGTIVKQSVIFLLASTCFYSCANFLNGNQLLHQLNEEIDYNTAKEVEFFIQPELNQGTTTPNGTQKKKMGYEFEIKFNPSDEYQFYQWTVIDSETGKQIDNAVTFEDKFSPSTKAIIHKEIVHLWIKPICFLIPKVTGIIPEYKATGKEQDSNIIITFNNPVKKEDFDGTFANFEISTDEQDLLLQEDCYFELPELSADGKQVTISTIKSKRILPEDSPFTYKNINVKIKLSTLTDTNNTAFKEDYFYTYKINKNTDTVIPEIIDFKIYKTKNEDGTLSNELTFAEIDKWNEEQFSQNHLKDKFYVYIKAKDEGDGVYTSKIKETQLYYTMGDKSTYETDYQPTYKAFTETQDGCYESYFEYSLTPEYDGIEKVDISIFDFAGNPLNLQPFYVIKDTSYSTSLWRFTNSYNIKPSIDKSDRITTTIYWACIEDVYAIYNDVSYKSSMQDLNIKFSYGYNLENLTEVELNSQNINYGEHYFLQNDLFFYNLDEENPSNHFDALNSGSYTIPYDDNTKDTYIRFVITDESGNNNSETYVIPAVRNFTSHKYSEEEFVENIYITDSEQNNLVENPIVFRVYDADEACYYAQSKSVFRIYNSQQNKVYMQPVYYFNEYPNQSTFFAPWSDYYSFESIDAVPAVPDIKIEKDTSKNMQGDKYCYKVTIDASDYNSSYKYLVTTSNTDKVSHYMSFVQEGSKMAHYFYHEHKDIEDTKFSIFIMNGSSCTAQIDIEENNWENTRKDIEGPVLYNWENYLSPAGGFCFDYCHDESGFKPYTYYENFSKAEYFFIPYLPVYKYTPLNLSETDMDKYKKSVELFSITDDNKLNSGYLCSEYPDSSYDETGYLINFDTKDLEDGNIYTLYAKVYDSKDNYTYEPVKNVCSNPLTEKLDCQYSNNNITANIKAETGFSDYKLVWETFSKENQCWKLNIENYTNGPDEDGGYYYGYDVNGIEYMDESNDNTYSKTIPENPDQFVRLCVYAREDTGNLLFANNSSDVVYKINTSKTQYIYTSSSTKCAVKNMIAGISGITIFCDKPCLYYICTSSVGYGFDQDKWERYGSRVFYNQIESSGNIDDSIVQPGEKYVVIAHFADNTTIMSPVIEN